MRFDFPPERGADTLERLQNFLLTFVETHLCAWGYLFRIGF